MKNKIEEANKLPESLTVYKQGRNFYKDIPGKEYGEKKPVLMQVFIRWDDECKNGHNTFSITGEIKTRREVRDPFIAGGCIHDDIEKHFPELAHFIKWHSWSSHEGPWGYITNTLYFAREDKAGIPCAWDLAVRFGDNPILHFFKPWKNDFIKFLQDDKSGFDFEIIEIAHDRKEGDRVEYDPKFTFSGYANYWHECPFDNEGEAERFLYALQNCNPVFEKVATGWTEGKEPDLEAARRCAAWPDATLEQLRDKNALEARLPAMMQEFKKLSSRIP